MDFFISSKNRLASFISFLKGPFLLIFFRPSLPDLLWWSTTEQKVFLVWLESSGLWGAVRGVKGPGDDPTSM